MSSYDPGHHGDSSRKGRVALVNEKDRRSSVLTTRKSLIGNNEAEMDPADGDDTESERQVE